MVIAIVVTFLSVGSFSASLAYVIIFLVIGGSIGAAVGAITFSGSIIAFLKLRGIMSGSPITFSGQHFLNLILGIAIFVLIFYLCKSQSNNLFWTIILASFLIGVLLIIPIGGA